MRNFFKKKFLSIILCVCFVALSFVGCSGPNADMTEENITATVETVETALKEFNTKKLKKYVNSSTLSAIITYADKYEQIADLGRAIFENLSIEITSIDIEEETVTIQVMNKDLYNTANSFASELKENYSSFQLLTKLGNEDFLNTQLNMLCNEISQDEMVSYPYEVTLEIEKNNKNLVLSFDELSEDAVSGGALSAIKSIYE